jgi:hypothetical protein
MAAASGVPIYVSAETFFPITNALLEEEMGLGTPGVRAEVTDQLRRFRHRHPPLPPVRLAT